MPKRTGLALSIIETHDGLALEIVTKEGERITIEASATMLAGFVSNAAKALQDHARKSARH